MKNKQLRSVKTQIVIAIIAVQIPLLILYYFLVSNMTQRISQEQITYQTNEQASFLSELEKEIQKIGEKLYGEMWYSFEGEDIDKTIIQEQCNDLIQDCTILDSIVVKNKRNSVICHAEKEEIPDEVFKEIEIQRDKDNIGWQLIQVQDEYYLYRTMKQNEYRVVSVIGLERLANNANNIYHLSGQIVFKDHNKYLNTTLWLRNANEEIPSFIEQNTNYILSSGTRKYSITEQGFVGLRVLYGTIYRYDWSWLYYFGLLLAFVALVSIGITLFYLTRNVLHPIKQMTGVMAEIGKGDINKRVPEMKNLELYQIGSTFNEMMDKLQDAKIESYEHQLTARKAKTDSLRLQIRRHFFLNCLKNIYAMASVGDIAGIKDTALLLSTNLRYTLNFDADTVELAQELEMCKDYIKLQGIGQIMKPSLTIHSDPKLNSFLIPPVSILTIMENSCKYANTGEKQLDITIETTIKMLDNQEYVILSIQDNGPGYDSETLKVLNQNIQDMKHNNHVGLANSLLRFQMLYGEETEALFSNNNGAKVEFIIPNKLIRNEEVA